MLSENLFLAVLMLSEIKVKNFTVNIVNKSSTRDKATFLEILHVFLSLWAKFSKKCGI